MDAIAFARQSDGTFKQSGAITTTHGRFQWLLSDGSWDGGWAVEPLEKLIERMAQGGPYKYRQYRVIPETKAPLVIEACCNSCGLAADIMRPYKVTESDLPVEPLTQQAIDALNFIYPGGNRAYSEEYVAQVTRWWDGTNMKWTGSPFFNAAVGRDVICCDYTIDKEVTNANHNIPLGFVVAPNGFITVKGLKGHFCSVFCLAMEMFLYRNRRCAGCGKYIPKKEWTSPEKFRGENYPKYRYCSEACKKRQDKFEFGVMSTEHVRRALGMIPVAVADKPGRRKRAPNKAYLERLGAGALA
jgi:hypothetical protein